MTNCQCICFYVQKLVCMADFDCLVCPGEETAESVPTERQPCSPSGLLMRPERTLSATQSAKTALAEHETKSFCGKYQKSVRAYSNERKSSKLGSQRLYSSWRADPPSSFRK